jgi:alpha-tubulin suppressor-like RCC1 family protein
MADNKKITEFPRSTPSGGFELVAATSAHNYKVSYTDFAEHSALGTKSGIFLDTLSISGFSIGGLPADFAVTKVSSESYESFFLTAAGDVYGCGYNQYGDLGLGDTTLRKVPTFITGASMAGGTAVTGVHTSNYNSLFLTVAGDVYGCGLNGDGELGLGDLTQRLYPTYITGLAQGAAVTGVSVGKSNGFHSLFLTAAGDAYGCGENQFGSLGLGDTTDRLYPTYITGLAQGAAVTEVSSEYYNSLFLNTAGDVYGCGYNDKNQLGLGNTTQMEVPTYITGSAQGTAVAGVSLGTYDSLFLTVAGDAYGCGLNSYGQLGLGDTVQRSVPTYITGLSQGSAVTDISKGGHHSLFLTAAGDAYGCGNNTYGQLGDGTAGTPKYWPTYITGVSQGLAVTDIAAADYSSLFLTSAGDAYGCGLNQVGQLGLGDFTQRLSPTYITGAGSTPTPADEDIWEEWSDVPASIASPGSSGDIAFDEDYFYICTSGAREHHITVAVADLTLSENDSLFLTPSGDVYGCGYNYAGELGVGGDPLAPPPVGTPQPYPVYITGLNEGSAVTSFSAATSNCFFVSAAGDAYGCGSDYFGQLGLAGVGGRAYPTHIIGPLDPGWNWGTIAGVSNSEQNSFFLSSSGDAFGCGRNNQGQLGVGDKIQKSLIVNITGLNIGVGGTAVTSISSSLNNTLFLNEFGDVYGCGYNQYGVLGLDNSTPQLYPTYITGLSEGSAVTGIWSSKENSFFLNTAGDVYGVGRNQYGELGLDNNTQKWVITRITGAFNGTAVSNVRAGLNNTLFLNTAGDIYGCGRNFNYALGLGYGYTTQIWSPTYITGSAVTDISQEGYNSLFLTAAGDAYGCGYNLRDQLGLGDQTVKYAPTHMSGAGSTPLGGPWRRAPLSSF